MKRVLVVDDSHDVRTMLQALLEQEGFFVAIAADGDEALTLQKAAPFDVVVTDIFMPGKEGIETIDELHRQFPQTKIIVLTGGGGAGKLDYLQIARQIGAAKAFMKPVPPRDLIAAIRELASSDQA
jgi:two-component system, chemotaxis family, chemotaxis protein CheY